MKSVECRRLFRLSHRRVVHGCSQRKPGRECSRPGQLVRGQCVYCRAGRHWPEPTRNMHLLERILLTCHPFFGRATRRERKIAIEVFQFAQPNVVRKLSFQQASRSTTSEGSPAGNSSRSNGYCKVVKRVTTSNLLRVHAHASLKWCLSSVSPQ